MPPKLSPSRLAALSTDPALLQVVVTIWTNERVALDSVGQSGASLKMEIERSSFLVVIRKKSLFDEQNDEQMFLEYTNSDQRY